MEFNEIWNNIAPYVGTGSFLTGVGVIVGIVIKILQLLRDIKKNANFQSMFKQALPKDLTVSVTALTKNEIDKLADKIENKFIAPIKENTILLADVAKAVASLRSVPETYKENIAKHCDGIQTNTVESIKLEMSPELVEVKKETVNKPISIE